MDISIFILSGGINHRKNLADECWSLNSDFSRPLAECQSQVAPAVATGGRVFVCWKAEVPSRQGGEWGWKKIGGYKWFYPLVISQFPIENGILVDLPIFKMVIFQFAMLVSQAGYVSPVEGDLVHPMAMA